MLFSTLNLTAISNQIRTLALKSCHIVIQVMASTISAVFCIAEGMKFSLSR